MPNNAAKTASKSVFIAAIEDDECISLKAFLVIMICLNLVKSASFFTNLYLTSWANSAFNFLLLFLDPPTTENEIRETKFTRAENLLFAKVSFKIVW